MHAFRHQREREYHKLLSVSEVTIVVEVWGEARLAASRQQIRGGFFNFLGKD